MSHEDLAERVTEELAHARAALELCDGGLEGRRDALHVVPPLVVDRRIGTGEERPQREPVAQPVGPPGDGGRQRQIGVGVCPKVLVAPRPRKAPLASFSYAYLSRVPDVACPFPKVKGEH